MMVMESQSKSGRWILRVQVIRVGGLFKEDKG